MNRGKYIIHEFDRERDLRLQRETFGCTLREWAEDPEAPKPPNRAKGEYKMVQLYYRLLGKKREQSA
jgi:hypothetical protein